MKGTEHFSLGRTRLLDPLLAATYRQAGIQSLPHHRPVGTSSFSASLCASPRRKAAQIPECVAEQGHKHECGSRRRIILWAMTAALRGAASKRRWPLLVNFLVVGIGWINPRATPFSRLSPRVPNGERQWGSITEAGVCSDLRLKSWFAGVAPMLLGTGRAKTDHASTSDPIRDPA